MSEKISFDIDWDSLFPGKPFTVGNKTHTVTPLNVMGIASITKKVKSILPMLQQEDITLDNVNSPDKLVRLVPILMENAPEVISDATMIDIESLVKFPPQYLLELVTVAVQVNMESKEALEKNFKSLVETFQNLPKAEAENLG